MVNLIGINGRIGSGKDTVTKIIQYNTGKLKYAVSLETFLNSNWLINNNNSTFEIKKFAGKLKEIASILTGIPIYKFEDQEFKKTLLGEEWGLPKTNSTLNNIESFKDITFVELMSVREFLQILGTECMRNNLHSNVWVNALFSEYNENSKWIISDMRFPNEYDSIKKHKGLLIKVNREAEIVSNHPSEGALDHCMFDYIIDNNATIEALNTEVLKILTKEKLI